MIFQYYEIKDDERMRHFILNGIRNDELMTFRMHVMKSIDLYWKCHGLRGDNAAAECPKWCNNFPISKYQTYGVLAIILAYDGRYMLIRLEISWISSWHRSKHHGETRRAKDEKLLWGIIGIYASAHHLYAHCSLHVAFTPTSLLIE